MLISNLLEKLFGDYSTRPPTSPGPEQDPFVLLPDADGTSQVSTMATYRTGDDGTLDIKTKMQHKFYSRILLISEGQVR